MRSKARAGPAGKRLSHRATAAFLGDPGVMGAMGAANEPCHAGERVIVSSVLDSILRNVKQDDSNNEVDSTPTMKSLRQAAASNSTIFWIALSAR
jgi:hypothetical protein